MATQGFCVEKGRLLTEYVRRVNDWSDTVRSLSKEVGVSSAEFGLLMVTVDSARASASRAKEQYADHVAEHGC
jgi:hypothetical protein